MKLEILRRALCLLMTVCLLTAVPSCGLLDLLPEDSSESEETEGPSPDSLPGIDSDEISEESVPVFSYVSADETSFSSDPERKAAKFIVRSVNRGIEALNEYGNGTRANVLDYDPASYPRAYDGLSEAGKTAYETMRKASAEFSGYEIRESELGGPNPYGVVVDAEYALFADYPEVSMYYSDDYGYDLHQPRYFLPNEYGRECEDIERVQEAVGFYRAVFDRILAWMPEGLENVQKCVYLTAVLCDACTYDTDYSTLLDPFPAYNAIVGGEAVCEGYTQAFRLLCHAAGVDCKSIRGKTAFDDEKHIWNVLETENGRRYIDVTWTDGACERSGTPFSFSYFLMTDEDLSYEGYLPDYESVE